MKGDYVLGADKKKYDNGDVLYNLMSNYYNHCNPEQNKSSEEKKNNRNPREITEIKNNNSVDAAIDDTNIESMYNIIKSTIYTKINGDLAL
jgi:hypothetical protein